MLRSRLFMLVLATLLIAQSAFGTALHRCHDGASQMATGDAVVLNMKDMATPCHGHVEANNIPTTDAGIDNNRHAAPHGICTCAMAHCAPGLISYFELPSTPVHATTVHPYRFVVVTAPTETLLRPPIVLS
jgi:hypothetical protein